MTCRLTDPVGHISLPASVNVTSTLNFQTPSLHSFSDLSFNAMKLINSECRNLHTCLQAPSPILFLPAALNFGFPPWRPSTLTQISQSHSKLSVATSQLLSSHHHSKRRGCFQWCLQTWSTFEEPKDGTNQFYKNQSGINNSCISLHSFRNNRLTFPQIFLSLPVLSLSAWNSGH